jgi:hypothetical protein
MTIDPTMRPMSGHSITYEENGEVFHQTADGRTTKLSDPKYVALLEDVAKAAKELFDEAYSVNVFSKLPEEYQKVRDALQALKAKASE